MNAVSRNAARGERAIAAIAAAGGSARFLGADISDPGDVRSLVEDAGEVDILVNNAGLALWGATEHLTVEDFDAERGASPARPGRTAA